MPQIVYGTASILHCLSVFAVLTVCIRLNILCLEVLQLELQSPFCHVTENVFLSAEQHSIPR
jgi:hypothetical protein